MGKRKIKAGAAAVCMAACAFLFSAEIQVQAGLVLEDLSGSFDPKKKEDEKKGEYYQISSENGKMTNILIELYRLQSQGYELDGWLELNGDFYYKQENEILTGLQEIGEEIYYFNENGKMETQCWKKVGEDSYFFSESGEAYREDSVQIEGTYYCFDREGRMQREQMLVLEEGTYYVGEDGASVKDQFLKLDKETYYFDENGRMTTGLIAVDGEEYYMGSDGKMKKGWQVINGRRYLFHLQTGKMLKGIKIGDIVIDKNGIAERPDSHMIQLEEMMQNPELPTGCESVALTIALNYYGFELEKTTIADEYLEYSDKNFVSAYVGNPHTESGAGCFAPAIETAGNEFLETVGSDLKAADISGASLEELYSYVANGTPVVVWNSMYMNDLEKTEQTYVYQGKTYYWYRKEHCVVLCGYDKEKGIVLINDPLEGIVERDAERFEEIYDQMGKMAVVIQQN